MAKNEQQIEHKFARFEMKSVDFEKSEFTGFSAGIGNEDLGGDIIEPGSFSKTIKERVSTGYIKLLDNHNDRSTRNVWGTVKEAREIPWEAKGENAPSHKLYTKFSVSEADPDAQIALRKIAEGHLDQLSIGYRPMKVEYEKTEDTDIEDPRMAWLMGQGIRRIKEVQWWETSVVIWGMNPEATIIQNSINRLADFAQKAAKSGIEIPEEEVKSAILALNNMIGKEADDSQRQAIAQALSGVSEAVDNVCSLAGKSSADPLQHLVEEYNKTHDVWKDESFSLWVIEQIKGNEEGIEEDDDCGCDEKELEEEIEEKEEEITVESTDGGEITISDESGVVPELKDPQQDELAAVLGKLTETLSEFKAAVVGAEAPSSEDESSPDAEEEELTEEKESHTKDVEEAAKDAEEDGRLEHFPGEEEVATELERLHLMALEFELDN